MSIYSSKLITKITTNPKISKVASMLTNHKALLPVIALETSVTSGRTFQAYKRGGITEARERIIDESLTAVVWFGIIGWLNSLFSKIISHKGIFDKKGLPEIYVDLGKDAIRNPIQHAIDLRPDIKTKIGGLKLTKIILSAVAGIYLSGVILPKFYQSVTAKILAKQKKEKREHEILEHAKVTMQEFLERTGKKTKQISFKGMPLTTFANILENNKIANLLTVDGGLFAGRMWNARNKDEAIEFGFRDISSSFFYLLSTPLIYNVLSKHVDFFRGKNTNIDPKTAGYITERIKEIIKNADINTYKKEILGEKVPFADEILNAIKDSTVSISAFKKLVCEKIKDKNLAENIIKKAQEFIDLRPEGTSKELLVKSEAQNALSSGLINNPKFLKEALEIATEGISQNPKKFVSFKELDKLKRHIGEFASSVIDYAQNVNAKQITEKLLNETRNRNLVVKLAYTVCGLIVSGLFLSTIIPKTQYLITKLRTGKNEFPGIRDLK